jgi:hypothetical protein
MDAKSSIIAPSKPSIGNENSTIWSSLVHLITSFDCPITKSYVDSCIAIVKKIESNTEPPVSGADLVAAIQTELPIPTSASELPPSGLLGLCVNFITIAHHAQEDPIEEAEVALNQAGAKFICIPGPHERASTRQRERESSAHGVSTHRFQIGVPNPPSNQLIALGVLSRLQL